MISNNNIGEFVYFSKLHVEGFKCFKNKQKLDMSDNNGSYSPWTIILGENGTGKTSLLRLIDRLQPEEEVFHDDEKAPIYVWDYPELKANIYFEIFINNEKNDYSITGPSFNTYKRNVWEHFFLLSYGASRRMGKTNTISFDNKDRLKTSSLFNDSIELINAEEWLLQKELLSEKAEPVVKDKFEKQLNQVKTILVDILPDVHNIRVKPINERNSKLIIEVETDYSWVSIRDLSFGYQTLTALIVDIAAKMMEQYPYSEEPLKNSVIILIDEIDLHLHPKWQRTVLDKLSEHFPKAQFIATSHSPLIVQAAQDRNANIIVCRKEGDKVIIDNNPDEVKGWRIDQILVSDLFNVESSRSKDIQKFINEKNEILSKAELLDNDKDRLKELNLIIESLPSSITKQNIEAEYIIKKAAELLKK